MRKVMIFIVTFFLVSCTNSDSYLYGKLNTKDLVSSVKKIELKYVYFDDKNNKLYENTLPVSIFGTYKIHKYDSTKIMLVYISHAKLKESTIDSNPFIMENTYIIDLTKLSENSLPDIIISSPVQINKYDQTGTTFSWDKLENADYYRIDFQREDDNIFDALFFVPKNCTSFDIKSIDNAEEIKDKDNRPDYKSSFYFIKNENIQKFDLSLIKYFQITGYKLVDNNSMQLTCSSQKFMINKE